MEEAKKPDRASHAGPVRGIPRWGWGGLQHVEGLFNPQGRQRSGFLLTLARAVPGRGREDPLLAEVARGQLNTNPVFSGYLAGVLVRGLEREAGREESEALVERIQSTFAPVLANLGDRLFWGGVRPLLSLIGILSASFWIGEPALWYWLGYNALQLYWRRRSWAVGLRGEAAVREEILGQVVERWAGPLARLTRFLLGLTLGATLTGLWSGQGVVWSAALLLFCASGYLIARRGRISPLALGWIGLAGAGLVAMARLVLMGGTV